jgi:AAA+ ATPase superfamily predicted ATPase
MGIDFIGRGEELARMEALAGLSPPPFLVVVGRRRVGKTRLVREFIKTQKKCAYFFVEEKRSQALLADLSQIAGEGMSFQDWEAFIRFVLSRHDVVVIDEFQNFDRVDPSFFSVLQKVLDEGGHRAMLVIVALPPLEVGEILPALKGNMENRLSLYAMFGGYPKYLVILNQYGISELNRVWSELVVRRFAPLNREPHNMLIMEFGGEYRTYFTILEGIARGKTGYVDISHHSGLSTTTLARYLDDLQAFGIIEKRYPVTEGPRSKKTRYNIKDNFVRFWFRYMFPRLDLIESERYGDVLEHIRTDFPNFMSWEFERIVRGILRRDHARVGPWWNRRGDEIDAVALDDDLRKMLICEVKWRGRKMGADAVEAVLGKGDLIQGYNGYDRKFMIVSKGGFTEKAIRMMDEADIRHLDLKEVFGMLEVNSGLRK